MATTRISFSGHETFPLRFNWLKKAVDEASEDPGIFNADRAIAKFGVGKNMVRSIRHWGLACGVLEDVEDGYDATDFGDSLFSEEGWDPYLEDIGTIWLLHWKLCGNPRPSPLWHFVFSAYMGRGVGGLSVLPAFKTWAETHDIDLPSDTTLNRDLKCLLATYTHRRSSRSDLEASLGSPFATLNLIHETDSIHHFRRGPQPSLPANVFAAAVLNFWGKRRPNQRTIAIDEVLNRDGSPGRVFKLSDNRAFDLLTQAERSETPPFSYSDTAGTRQLLRTDEHSSVSVDTLLKSYFASTQQGILS